MLRRRIPARTRTAGVLLALFLPACQSCPVEARARVLAPDFGSPEAAGRSFLAAFGCDDAEAEYRCLGESLKERYGATLDLYLLGRPRLREELGAAVRFAARLQAARVSAREDGVLVWWSYAGRDRIGLLMERQWYYDVTLDDGSRRGATLPGPPGDYVALGRRELSLRLRDAALRGLGDAHAITAVEVGTEWKIAGFLPPPEEAPGTVPGAPAAPSSTSP